MPNWSSYLSNNTIHISQSNHGLDIEFAHRVLSEALSAQKPENLLKLASLMKESVFNQIQNITNYPSLECLRFFLIIIVSTILEIAEFCDILLIPFSKSFSIIHETPSIALGKTHRSRV